MTKSNTAEIIAEHVEKLLSLPFTIYTDLFADTEKEGMCIRHDPTPCAERRFADGSRLVSWNFTFYVRSGDSEKAREWAKQIIDRLDGTTIERTDGGAIDLEGITYPQFIDTDSKNNTIYSVSIKGTYLEEAE